MDALSDLIKKANIKAILIGKLNNLLVGVLAGCIVTNIACWIAAIQSEDSGFSRRYIACVLSVITQVAVGALILISQRVAPSLLLYYAQEWVIVASLFLTAIAMGMNNVVVNVCATGNVSGASILCGAHIVETIADTIACVSLMVCFAASQQRVVTFVDKGILDGIKGRTNASQMQALP
mmetsp:Transcript_10972/g.12586  ORF Transcript_10972/g.12586 Transcript_10972/m.12586 type:complete len:179 (-) Transcript_10972:44-580(-)